MPPAVIPNETLKTITKLVRLDFLEERSEWFHFLFPLLSHQDIDALVSEVKDIITLCKNPQDIASSALRANYSSLTLRTALMRNEVSYCDPRLELAVFLSNSVTDFYGKIVLDFIARVRKEDFDGDAFYYALERLHSKRIFLNYYQDSIYSTCIKYFHRNQRAI